MATEQNLPLIPSLPELADTVASERPSVRSTADAILPAAELAAILGQTTGRTALSVNVNKVALLRNTRHLGIPSVLRAAHLCLLAGARGITVHPRPDERHIKRDDVYELAAMMTDWPGREFNIEGNPFHNLMEFVRELKPD
ncbi:MAG: pyridoxine 5'-phosphate synthase, partial [Polaromonas sp.]|nr:pyridoxine 5'-phosphate synthase [Polaromonas sp.]